MHWLSIGAEFNDLGWPWTPKYGVLQIIFTIWGCASLYHSQVGATVANAARAYGRCVLWSRRAESKWYAIFETITTELEML